MKFYNNHLTNNGTIRLGLLLVYVLIGEDGISSLNFFHELEAIWHSTTLHGCNHIMIGKFLASYTMVESSFHIS